MNNEQVELVQSSFAKVAPIADQAAIIFYDELFQRDPSLRPLFTEDMTEQRKKLMTMLGMAVNGLKNWDSTQRVVANLGARHVGYGVKPEYYPTVGAALLATLSKGLGDDFTPEVEEAWTAAYTALSGTMIEAAADKAVAE
ncbi:hemin receptor [Planctomonas sp. JC2975]|uniref:globin family protein n=1 Tax=Planctomonas sp. JC2975 TaxID=2729626 RepID=UPI001475317E|nr:globin family protein [Planctomonas sp. JC2975]NNC12263.1 hemin receptor [Planctomonas sp. JC2975]